MREVLEIGDWLDGDLIRDKNSYPNHYRMTILVCLRCSVAVRVGTMRCESCIVVACRLFCILPLHRKDFIANANVMTKRVEEMLITFVRFGKIAN
jgi:hypothetical protein